MKRWLTIALGGLLLSCQGPVAAMAQAPYVPATVCSMAPKIE